MKANLGPLLLKEVGVVVSMPWQGTVELLQARSLHAVADLGELPLTEELTGFPKQVKQSICTLCRGFSQPCNSHPWSSTMVDNPLCYDVYMFMPSVSISFLPIFLINTLSTKGVESFTL